MNLFSYVIGTNLGTKLKYNKKTNIMSLITSRGTQNITIPSSFDGKKIVIWLTENSNANITKLAISNYSSTLTQASSSIGNQRLNFALFTENGIRYNIAAAFFSFCFFKIKRRGSLHFLSNASKRKDKGPLSYLAIEEKGYSELSQASVSEWSKVWSQWYEHAFLFSLKWNSSHHRKGFVLSLGEARLLEEVQLDTIFISVVSYEVKCCF